MADKWTLEISWFEMHQGRRVIFGKPSRVYSSKQLAMADMRTVFDEIATVAGRFEVSVDGPYPAG